MRARRYRFPLAVFITILALTAVTSQAAGKETQSPQLGKHVADFTLRDHLGTEYSLVEWREKQIVVIMFLGTECPLAKLYATRLQQMADDYADRSVQFVGIISNRQDTLEKVAHYARTHNIEFPLLKDPGNRVADQFGAQRTPEVYVLDGERLVRYLGRIDDQFGVGYARHEKGASYLAQAIDELLAGKPVSIPVVQSVGCYIGRVRRDEPSGDVTYTKEIAPILNQHCVRCHRPGEVAPFALTSYDEVVGWSETIVEVVRDGRMPPWHASPAHGTFANDARLPDEAKQLLEAWVESGSPEGDAADLPPLPEFVEGWQIPPPDVVYQMPKPFDVPARGVVPYQHFYLDESIDEELWIRAAEMRPGNREVVHHLILFYVPAGQARHRGEDALQNHIVSFAPGLPALVLPEGYALRVPAGSRLVIQAHYTPNGSPQSDRSKVGIVLADPRTVKHEVSIAAGLNYRFLIPPGEKNYRVEATYRVGQDSLLFSLTPHMHYRGKSFRFTARYPDGGEEILLDVPRYDFNWQNVYKLAEPLLLPEATEVQMTAHYDNSAENLSNPDPTKSVHWGDQTWEEMMIGTLSLSPADQDLRLGPPRVEPVAGDPHRRRVHFRYRPTRGEKPKVVYLAGSFNEWQPTAHALDGPDADDFFNTFVELPPGRHEYKFVLDGAVWRPDPGNREQTGYHFNSVLLVE